MVASGASEGPTPPTNTQEVPEVSNKVGSPHLTPHTTSAVPTSSPKRPCAGDGDVVRSAVSTGSTKRAHEVITQQDSDHVMGDDVEDSLTPDDTSGPADNLSGKSSLPPPTSTVPATNDKDVAASSQLGDKKKQKLVKYLSRKLAMEEFKRGTKRTKEFQLQRPEGAKRVMHNNLPAPRVSMGSMKHSWGGVVSRRVVPNPVMRAHVPRSYFSQGMGVRVRNDQGEQGGIQDDDEEWGGIQDDDEEWGGIRDPPPSKESERVPDVNDVETQKPEDLADEENFGSDPEPRASQAAVAVKDEEDDDMSVWSMKLCNDTDLEDLNKQLANNSKQSRKGKRNAPPPQQTKPKESLGNKSLNSSQGAAKKPPTGKQGKAVPKAKGPSQRQVVKIEEIEDEVETIEVRDDDDEDEKDFPSPEETGSDDEGETRTCKSASFRNCLTLLLTHFLPFRTQCLRRSGGVRFVARRKLS